jgi:hypothetical protein
VAAGTQIRIPFVEGMLRPETVKWGNACRAQFWELEPDDESYYRAFREWWLTAEVGDLIVVEQDIVPPVGAMESMMRCRHSAWCACWYYIYPVGRDGRKDRSRGALPFGMGLGCTRFADSLRRAHPELADRAGEKLVFGPEPDPDPPRAWWVMDMRLTTQLLRMGHLPHDHGQARHLI